MTSAATMMVGRLAVQSTLGSWFVERRGVAMTCMMVIGASSSFIAPPAVNAIMGATGGGWRSGWYLIAALVALAIPVAFFLVKNHPSDIGEIPDGTSGAKVAAKKCDYRFVVYKNKKRAFRSSKLFVRRRFGSFPLRQRAGSRHIRSRLRRVSSILRRSVSIVVLLLAGVALMGAMGLVGKISMGIVSDRIEPIRLIVVAALILVIGIVVGAEASSDAMLLVFYACIGVGFGGVNGISDGYG